MMPFEKKEASGKIIELIKNSKKTIDIAMYSFTNKEFSKALKDASNRGVKIRVVLDKKSDNEQFSQGGYLAKYKNISVYHLEGIKATSGKYNGKMHSKMAIIDDKYLFIGSANWSFSAFDSNYETLFLSDNFETVNRALKGFNSYIKEAKEVY